MPMYDYQCTHCEAIIEDIMLPYDQRDIPLTEPCPYCAQVNTVQRLISAPNIGDSVRLGRLHLPSAWTDKLSQIKAKHHRSTMRVPTPGKREL